MKSNTPSEVVEEILEDNRKKHDQKPFDPTEGKEIAPAVYRVGNMVYVGDKL